MARRTSSGPTARSATRARRLRPAGLLVLTATIAASVLPAGAASAAGPDLRRVPVPAGGPVGSPVSGAARHGLGALPPTGRISATQALAALGHHGYRTASAPPASVDLSAYALAPGDQGQLGSCVAWAEAYSIAGWMSNYQHHAGAPLAPLYVYNQINGGRDGGSNMDAGLSLLDQQGAAEQAFWTHGPTDFRSQPTPAERANAAQHRFGGHVTLWTGANQGPAAQTALQTALAAHLPVAISLPVYSAFDALNTSDSLLTKSEITGAVRGYHALAVFGYDATGIKVENSWGSGWGDRGWATLGWDFVTTYVNSAYTTSGFASADTGMPPIVTRLSMNVASSAGGSALQVTAGRLASVDLTSGTPLSLLGPGGTVVPLTVTASAATTLTTTLPALPAGSYRVVVTGSGGASAGNGAVDTLTVVEPYAVALATGAVARSTGGTDVGLAGTGFGASAAAFSANRVTAQYLVGSAVRTLPVKWVSDTRISVTMPAGVAGSTLAVTVLRNGIASAPVAVPYLAPTPVVTVPSTTVPGGTARVSTDGGTTLVLGVVGLPTVADGVTVRLVSVADPSVSQGATVSGRTAGTLSITVPAAPVNGGGAPVEGLYRVVVPGSGGDSTPNGTRDLVLYRSPLSAAAAAGTLASAAGGSQVLLTGTFAATAPDFARSLVTATVGRVGAPLTWVDATHVRVTVPPGVPGVVPALVLVHDGVSGPPVTGLGYAAVITGNSLPTGRTSGGWTTSLTGVGFAGAGDWVLLDSTGTTVASLPVLGSVADLASAGSGVVVTGSGRTAPDTATVKLPAAPGATPGVYRLSFTPDAGRYPGAVLGFTARAVVVYADLG